MERSFTASTAAPREARRFVGDVLTRAGATDAVADDLRLAVSELVANAVEHGGAGPVRVSLDLAHQFWTLAVTAPSATAAAFAAATLPVDPDRPRGRGLAIVATVCQDVAVEHRDGVLVVRCRRRVS